LLWLVLTLKVSNVLRHMNQPSSACGRSFMNFRNSYHPMPHELPQNPTYSMKLSSTGKRRYRSGNAMRSISICQTMRAPNPFAQKQLQTSNIILGRRVPMGRVQLLCPISSPISMPTCDTRTSSIHLHPKKIGSLVLGSYGLG